MISIDRVPPKLGARVSGVDLARPLDDVTFAAIFEAFNEYSMLVFPKQALSDDEQIAFSRRFGALEETITSIANKPNVACQIADLSDVDADDHMIDPDDTRMIYHSPNQMCRSEPIP